MEERIKSRFNEAILADCCERFGINPDNLKNKGGFESFIYEYTLGNAECILRISHSFRRNEKLIRGEVDWINYLSARGAPVSRAILSVRNHLVECIPDGHGESYLATAFLKAPGNHMNQDHWNHDFYRYYGQSVGQLHQLTKTYTPKDPLAGRPHWDDPDMLEIEKYLPENDGPIIKQFKLLMERLYKLPKNRDNYGLIHFDAHYGNFFVNDCGKMTLFDFDDCCYSWFANDIAIVIFYAVSHKPDPAAFAKGFIPSFLRGYSEKAPLNPEWISWFPEFLKLREIDLYAIIHRSFDVENLTDEWASQYMAGRRERIIENIPYLDFDFNELSV